MRRSFQISVAIGLVLSLASIGFCAISSLLFSKAACQKHMNLDIAMSTPLRGAVAALPCQVDALRVFILPCSAQRENESTNRIPYKSAGRSEHPMIDTVWKNGAIRVTQSQNPLPPISAPLYSLFCVFIC